MLGIRTILTCTVLAMPIVASTAWYGCRWITRAQIVNSLRQHLAHPQQGAALRSAIRDWMCDDADHTGSEVDVGFASFRIPDGDRLKLTRRIGTSIVLEDEASGLALLFLVDADLLFGSIAANSQQFAIQLKLASMTLRVVAELRDLPFEEFAESAIRAEIKAMTGTYELGVARLQTDEIDSIVSLGKTEQPWRVHSSVVLKMCGTAFGLHVTSRDAALSKRRTREVLCSLRLHSERWLNERELLAAEEAALRDRLGSGVDFGESSQKQSE